MSGEKGGDGSRPSQKTYRGYATPDVEAEKKRGAGMFDDETVINEGQPEHEAEPTGELKPPQAASTPKRSIHDAQPLVEVEVVHQHGPAPRVEQPPQTLEIWTQNRIYTLDPQLFCVGVADRASGKADPSHPFLGYKLVGGQHRDGHSFEISYPYPRPGTEAVFEQPQGTRGNFSRTSTVTRVVLRLHVVTVSPNVLVPTWDRITNHELALPAAVDDAKGEDEG